MSSHARQGPPWPPMAPMAHHDPPWPAMSRYGRPWTAVAHHGQTTNNICNTLSPGALDNFSSRLGHWGL